MPTAAPVSIPASAERGTRGTVTAKPAASATTRQACLAKPFMRIPALQTDPTLGVKLAIYLPNEQLRWRIPRKIKWCLSHEAAGLDRLSRESVPEKRAFLPPALEQRRSVILVRSPGEHGICGMEFPNPDHSALADSTDIAFAMRFTLGKGARLDDRRRALRPHAAGRPPAEPAPGQRLPPRRAAAPAAGQRHSRQPRNPVVPSVESEPPASAALPRGAGPQDSGSHLTRCWRKQDSNPRSLSDLTLMLGPAA
jgi:hypothetical protein